MPEADVAVRPLDQPGDVRNSQDKVVGELHVPHSGVQGGERVGRHARVRARDGGPERGFARVRVPDQPDVRDHLQLQFKKDFDEKFRFQRELLQLPSEGSARLTLVQPLGTRNVTIAVPWRPEAWGEWLRGHVGRLIKQKVIGFVLDSMMEDTGDKQVKAVVSGLCQLAVVAEMARGEEFTEAQSEQLDDAVMDALATMSHKKLDPKLLRNLSILIARLWHARLDRDRDEHKARNLAGVDLDAKTAFEDRAKIVFKAVVGKRGDEAELDLAKFNLAMEIFRVPLSPAAAKQIFAIVDVDASGGINQEEFSEALDHTADHLVGLVRTATGLSRDQLVMSGLGSTLLLMGVLAFLLFGITALGSWAQFNASINSMLTLGGAFAVSVISDTEAVETLVEKTQAKLHVLLDMWSDSPTIHSAEFAKATAFENEVEGALDLAATPTVSVLPWGRIHRHTAQTTSNAPWLPKTKEGENPAEAEAGPTEAEKMQMLADATAARAALSDVRSV